MACKFACRSRVSLKPPDDLIFAPTAVDSYNPYIFKRRPPYIAEIFTAARCQKILPRKLRRLYPQLCAAQGRVQPRPAPFHLAGQQPAGQVSAVAFMPAPAASRRRTCAEILRQPPGPESPYLSPLSQHALLILRNPRRKFFSPGAPLPLAPLFPYRAKRQRFLAPPAAASVL